MVSNAANDQVIPRSRRRLRLWWFVIPVVLVLLALSSVLWLRPPLTKQAARFQGTWTYRASGGTKTKFIQFRADGSARWWTEGDTSLRSGSYLEWELDGDSMEIRQYSTKRSAVWARMMTLVHGPYEGEEYEVVWNSDDEFTMRQDYRDRVTGEIKTATIVYRRAGEGDIDSGE